MKSFRFLALLLIPIFAIAATMTKRPGTILEHNYVATNNWKFGTGISIATSDTQYLYLDSANAKGFTTSSLKYRSVQSSTFDKIPDSLAFCLEGVAITDAADFTNVPQYSLDNGTTWDIIGSALTITLGTTREIACKKVMFMPAANYRLLTWISTATDTVTLYRARVFPSYK